MAHENTPPPFVIQLVSQPGYLCAVRASVETLARQAGFSEDESGRIVMAVDEALANVIRHGYRGRADRPIWLRLWPRRDNGSAGIRIEIEDECDPVDPATIRGRDLDKLRPGGLGVHIIRQAMDDVRYEQRDDGRGMRLIMSKQLPSAEVSADKG